MYIPQTVMNEIGEPIRSMLFPNSMYGLGWGINNYYGHRLIMHGGNIDGFSAEVSFMPDEDIGVVVLTNKTTDFLPEVITRSIYDRLLELESKDWSAHYKELFSKVFAGCGMAPPAADNEQSSKTNPSLPLTEYTGLYEHPGFGQFEVVLSNEELCGIYADVRFGLKHFRFDVFQLKESLLAGQKVQFKLNVDGGIESLSIALESGIGNTVFKRVKKLANLSN